MGTVGGRCAHWGVLACIAVIAALAAAGCTGSSATPQTIYITPSPGPVTPLPSGVTPAPTVVLPVPAIDSVVISSNAPDNRWQVTFKKAVVSGISDAAATKMNGAIADKINAYIGAFTGGSLPAVAGGAGPSTLEGDFSIALDSPTLLGLRFTVLTHVSGSANMAEEPGSINFAVSSGATINLADLFSDQAKALSTITAAVKVDLNAQLGTDLTWDGKASSLSFYDKAWAMTPTGLEVAFAQGSMASAAAGMPTSTIPWSALKSVVKPDSPAGEFVK